MRQHLLLLCWVLLRSAARLTNNPSWLQQCGALLHACDEAYPGERAGAPLKKGGSALAAWQVVGMVVGMTPATALLLLLLLTLSPRATAVAGLLCLQAAVVFHLARHDEGL